MFPGNVEFLGNREFSVNQSNSVPEEMTNERDALAHHILNNPSIPSMADHSLRRNFRLLDRLDARSCELQYFIGLGCSFP